MKDNNSTSQEKGKNAEDLACKFLQELGYIIIKRNFHYGKIGEIDIVAKDGDELVFVEVKARTNNDYGSPLDFITPRKQKVIHRVADGYYYINKLEEQESRFDVITIEYQSGKTEIEHYICAFY